MKKVSPTIPTGLLALGMLVLSVQLQWSSGHGSSDSIWYSSIVIEDITRRTTWAQVCQISPSSRDCPKVLAVQVCMVIAVALTALSLISLLMSKCSDVSVLRKTESTVKVLQYVPVAFLALSSIVVFCAVLLWLCVRFEDGASYAVGFYFAFSSSPVLMLASSFAYNYSPILLNVQSHELHAHEQLGRLERESNHAGVVV